MTTLAGGVKGEHCITVWVSEALKNEFNEEVQKLDLNRSAVMRQLIKRWLIQRKVGGKKEPIEEAMA